MIDKKTWTEFRQCGLLWFINMILHTFGWALVVDIDDNGEITNCYPARVKFRGFDIDTNTKGYIAVSEYLKNNINDLTEEAKH